MPQTESEFYTELVRSLIPALSRRQMERFNVFRIMHHGTHEKQTSNVFAWLLSADDTHNLGDTFQRIFVRHVRTASTDSSDLPDSGFTVEQEIDTAGQDSDARDIADIVLSSPHASIVIENYYTSDGHGHDYRRYFEHGATGGRASTVVLLCGIRELHRLQDGWDQAAVVTYSEVLDSLKDHIAADGTWQAEHPDQHFFLRQVFEHFTEGFVTMNKAEQIRFLKAMCETGESARYGYRPHDRAGLEFAEQIGRKARQQFEDTRAVLAEAKSALRSFAEHALMVQVNESGDAGEVASVYSKYVGQWEWAVTLERPDAQCNVHVEFGPSAVAENGRAPNPLSDPDFSMLFVTRGTPDGDGIDAIAQTSISLEELLNGLPADDTRLRDAVLGILGV